MRPARSANSQYAVLLRCWGIRNRGHTEAAVSRAELVSIQFAVLVPNTLT